MSATRLSGSDWESWPPWLATKGHFIGTGWGPFIAVTALVTTGFFFLFNRVSIVPIETDVLRQVLLTVGFAFLFQQGALDIWGGNNMDINPPQRAHAEHRRRRHVFAALSRVHDRHGAGVSASCCGW